MRTTPPIERLDLYRLSLPLRTPWKTSYGVESVVETIYAKAIAGPDSAWFESCPLRMPNYMPDCAASTFAVLRDHLAARALGATSPQHVHDRLRDIRGNTYARNLLEGVAWSLITSEKNTDLSDLLGASSTNLLVGTTLSLHSPIEDLCSAVNAAFDQQIRFKFTSPDDLSVLRAVRNTCPNACILIDCNAAFSMKDLPLLLELDQLRLSAIEQPLHYRDLVEHARLQEKLATPICLDESITCFQDAKSAISLGSAKLFNLKPGRVGGIITLEEILKLAQANAVDCFIGGMLESNLGASVNRMLAGLPGITRPSDLPDPNLRYKTIPPIEFTETDLAPFIIEKAHIRA